MKAILKKLLIGKVTFKEQKTINPLKKRIQNLKSIWNNDHHDDNGIEKIVRLILSFSQLLFPGVYIKYFAHKKGIEYQDLALDFYVLIKVIFPIVILINNWHNNKILVGIMIYVLLETIFYIPTLIFASDLFSKPRSYKRSMLLLFLNYLEVVFAFSVLYSIENSMNKPFAHWFDSIYFSIVTSSSIGYGDYYPASLFGKVLVSFQSMFFLSFVVLFLNFFSTKVKAKGYFDQEDEE
ncbi:potassium channel family protein [Flavobacterium sp.]|uniref:potassium channel family protein n=1 Tax=Flavobacterium sp. TaxID=239 RepID=UPI00286C2EAA|nr:potassium channel family protein [Flavobacterium sp.]